MSRFSRGTEGGLYSFRVLLDVKTPPVLRTSSPAGEAFAFVYFIDFMSHIYIKTSHLD